MTYWLAIALGGLATYLTRALPLVITERGPMPDGVRRYVDALPIAVIAALAGAGIAVPDTVTGGAEVVAAVAALAVAAWRKNLLFAVLAGVAVVALLRAVGL
ncbi:MAG: AzlD domain-containing protein [Chloroflexota bacterium]|nr:AzlD domain-containing protein [Chloroflexota bacterium]